MKVLLPKRTSSSVLQLTSDIDFTKYHFLLSSTVFGEKNFKIEIESLVSLQNMTDMSIGVFVESDNLHWLHMITQSQQRKENPFETSSKLVEILPSEIYNVPMVLTKSARFFLKPAMKTKCSLSENSFSISEDTMDDCIVWAKSLETGNKIGFRVKCEERDLKKTFTILPYSTITNSVPVDIQIGLQEGTVTEKCLNQGEKWNLYENISKEITMKVGECQTSLVMKPSWQSADYQSKQVVFIRDKDCLKSKFLLTSNFGDTVVGADYTFNNQTKFRLKVDAGKQFGCYEAASGETIFLSSLHQHKLQNIQLHFESGDHTDVQLETQSFTAKVSSGEEFCFNLTIDTTSQPPSIILRSQWIVRNNIGREFLLQNQRGYAELKFI